MAYIEERKKKDGTVTYRITVSAGYNVKGKQIRKKYSYTPEPGMTERQIKKEVNKIAVEFEQMVLNGNLYDGSKMTLIEFYYKWLSEYAEISLEQTTVEWYKQMFENKILPKLGHLKLAEIKTLHIQTFCNNLTKTGATSKDKPYSPASVKRYHAAINSILNKAVEWELITSNPAKRVSLPKQKTVAENVKCFTPEQAITFLNALNEAYSTEYTAHTRIINDKTYSVSAYQESRAIPTQFKVLFNIAIYGGLRLGELLALTWDDIDFENNTISISKSTARLNGKVIIKAPKNKTSVRVISIYKSVMELIRYYKTEQNKLRLMLGQQWKGDGHLFIQWNGKLMNQSTPYHTLKKIINKYNATVENDDDKLPSIRFHDLRHTSATLLIAANTDIKTVSTRLGHAQTSTTMNIYAHTYKKVDEIASDTLGSILDKPQTCNLP